MRDPSKLADPPLRDADAARLRRFVARSLLGLIGSLFVATVFIVPGFVAGVQQGFLARPRGIGGQGAVNLGSYLAQSIDAFLVPILGAVVAACLAGSLTGAGGAFPHAFRRTRVAATLFAICLGLLHGAVVYALVGWVLPGLSQAEAFPAGVPPERMLEIPPFLLTNSELWSVQHQFRRIGGFSTGVALTLEVRMWASASVPLLALVAAALLVADRPRSHLLRLLLVQAIAIAVLLIGLFLTLGPVLLMRPPRAPQHVAWAASAAAAIASAWWLMRRLAVPAAPSGLGLLRHPMDASVGPASDVSDVDTTPSP